MADEHEEADTIWSSVTDSTRVLELGDHLDLREDATSGRACSGSAEWGRSSLGAMLFEVLSLRRLHAGRDSDEVLAST